MYPNWSFLHIFKYPCPPAVSMCTRLCSLLANHPTTFFDTHSVPLILAGMYKLIPVSIPLPHKIISRVFQVRGRGREVEWLGFSRSCAFFLLAAYIFLVARIIFDSGLCSFPVKHLIREGGCFLAFFFFPPRKEISEGETPLWTGLHWDLVTKMEEKRLKSLMLS